jgi:hypothetical protein
MGLKGVNAARKNIAGVQNQEAKEKLESGLDSSPSMTSEGVIKAPISTPTIVSSNPQPVVKTEVSHVPRPIPKNSPGVNTQINPSVDPKLMNELRRRHHASTVKVRGSKVAKKVKKK